MKFLLLFLFLVGSAIAPLSGEEEVPSGDEAGNPFQKDKVDKAIEKGIAYIAKKQQSDGSIHDRGNPTAMTALSLMSMAAVGHNHRLPLKTAKAPTAGSCVGKNGKDWRMDTIGFLAYDMTPARDP